MSLAKIISIPGMSGLFKMVAQMRNGGFIVESLSDQKRLPVSSSQRIVMLEDISVYTMEGDMPLKEVFLKMKTNEEVTSGMTGVTDAGKLKEALKKIIPEFDEERVHASDIKKMFSWFSLLKDIVTEDEPETETETKEGKDKPAAEDSETKPKKRAAKAKSDAAEAPAKTKKKADADASPAKAKKTNEADAVPAKKAKAKSESKKS